MLKTKKVNDQYVRHGKNNYVIRIRDLGISLYIGSHKNDKDIGLVYMHRWYFSKKLNSPKDIAKLCLPSSNLDKIEIFPCEYKIDLVNLNSIRVGIFHHIVIDSEAEKYNE